MSEWIDGRIGIMTLVSTEPIDDVDDVVAFRATYLRFKSFCIQSKTYLSGLLFSFHLELFLLLSFFGTFILFIIGTFVSFVIADQ